jgi:TonB family protein
MFDKLVVSTNERRKARTARFFLGTVVTYLVVVASALAVSVIVSSPKLADTEVLCKIAPPPPLGGPTTTRNPPKPHTESQRQDPTRVLDFETVAHRTAGPPTNATTNLPGPTNVEANGPYGEGGPGVGPAGPAGPGVGGGIDVGDRTSPAPRPQPPTPIPVADNTPKMVRMISSVLQGKAIERVTPIYPSIAKPIHLQGTVSVEVIISPEGRVESARSVSGHPVLARAAVDAAYGWRFEPTLLNGHAVRVTGVITFNFRMD